MDHHYTIQSSDDASRTIGYTLVKAKNPEHRSTAIVYLYPLSGCSLAVSSMASAVEDYPCSTLAVDRPDCGKTSSCNNKSNSNDDPILDRMHVHAQDTIHVLVHEGIKTIYILSVCLGHPYAIALCLELLQSPTPSPVRVQALTLVAPFCSTASPYSWWIARWGRAIGKPFLYGITSSMTMVESVLLPCLLTPHAVRKMITPAEQAQFGWTDTDFTTMSQTIVEWSAWTRNAKGVETRVGASPVWQSLCDAFAVENGFGVVLVDDDEQQQERHHNNAVKIPVTIHASSHDSLASVASIQWLARRCYGSCPLVLHKNVCSHEAMCCLAGPPRTPHLLHQVAREEWGFLIPETAKVLEPE